MSMKFDELGLPDHILQALKKMGFDSPTPIQETTYPIIMEGKDLCALAETGSGKTAACAIPLIARTDPSRNCIQALIIVPTRELCLQYVDEIYNIGRGSRIIPFAAFGGFSKGIQAAKLRDEVHILVATPGRLIDLIYSGDIDLNHIETLILDEADELLKEGFKDDMEFIMSLLMQEHQTLLFAATMAGEIRRLVDDYLIDPVHVSLIEKKAQPDTIAHFFQLVHPRQREREIKNYIAAEKIDQLIIFCNARYKVDDLHRVLRKDLNNIEYLHAGLSQDKRSSIFRRFKKGQIRTIIATDVAGRGLDFVNVSHVINWDFPMDLEQYTHRTGRSGRMGREGKALTYVTQRDLRKVRTLVQRQNIKPRWIGKDPLKDGSTAGGRDPGRDRNRPRRPRNSRPPRGK